MSKGNWIKLHRSIEDADFLLDLVDFAIWTKLLLRANYKTSQVIFNGRLTVLYPGQLHVSVRSLAKEFGVSKDKLFGLLERATSSDTVTTVSDNKSTVITIINWDTYQSSNTEDVYKKRHESDTEPTPLICTKKKEERITPSTEGGGDSNSEKRQFNIQTLIDAYPPTKIKDPSRDRAVKKLKKIVTSDLIYRQMLGAIQVYRAEMEKLRSSGGHGGARQLMGFLMYDAWKSYIPRELPVLFLASDREAKIQEARREAIETEERILRERERK